MLKTKKDIFKLMLDNLSELDSFGLCRLLFTMQSMNLINRKERRLAEDFLFDAFYDSGLGSAGYHWPPGEVEPRKKWLIEQINICNAGTK